MLLVAQQHRVTAAPPAVVNGPAPNDGSIGDYVWWDWEGDGIQNESPDAGLNDVTVRRLDSTGQVISSTVTSTDANSQPGYYHFAGLTIGASCQIEVVPPTDFGFTRPNNICPTTPCSIVDAEAGDDSDIDPVTGRSAPQAIAVGPTFPGGECIDCSNVDAGLVLLG